MQVRLQGVGSGFGGLGFRGLGSIGFRFRRA